MTARGGTRSGGRNLRIVGGGGSAGGPGEPPDDDGWNHATPEPPLEELIAELAKDTKGKVASLPSNVALLVHRSDEWSLWFDEFAGVARVEAAPPIGGKPARVGVEVDDYIVETAQHWLAEEHQMDAGSECTLRGLIRAAKQDCRDPVKEYLLGLKWDEQPRVESWLSVYLGAEPSPITAAMGRMWLISGVARVIEPGCKVDHMLVLVGSQGDRKTSALEALCGIEWFQPDLPELRDKDSQQALRGVWIVCMDEMNALRKSDVVELAKNYLTRRVDRYRPSYGRLFISVPRRCIFAGTCNPTQFLHDPTGNRRFWVVPVKNIDVAGIARDRDQLWAEAVSLFQSGKQWWPSKETSKAIDDRNRDYTNHDEWQPTIEGLHVLQEHVTVGECLGRLGFKQEADWTQADQNRVAKILSSLGRERKRITRAGKQCWVYVRKVIPPDVPLDPIDPTTPTDPGPVPPDPFPDVPADDSSDISQTGFFDDLLDVAQ